MWLQGDTDSHSLFDTKNRSSTRNANIYQKNLGERHKHECTVSPKKEWKAVMCVYF